MGFVCCRGQSLNICQKRQKIIRSPAYSLHPRTVMHRGGRRLSDPSGLLSTIVAGAKYTIEDCADDESKACSEGDLPQKSDRYTSFGCCPDSRLLQCKAFRIQERETYPICASRLRSKHAFDAFGNPLLNRLLLRIDAESTWIRGSQISRKDKGSRSVHVEDKSN